MIECSVYEATDGRWVYWIEPDFDATGFGYLLTGVRASAEDAGWAATATVNELNFWFWKQRQLSIEFQF